MKGAVHKALDARGQDVTLTNYEKTGEDDYGENWSQTSDSPKTITARVERRSVPTPDRDQLSAGEVRADARIFVKDTVTGIRDGGGEGASEIDVDGQTYYVLEEDPQDNGLVRLFCVRED